MKHHRLVTIIRRSCLTGNAVWIYRGPSRSAGQRAYQRACNRELLRARHHGETVRRRSANVASLLSACLAALPAGAEFTPRQAEAVRTLEAVRDGGTDCHGEFYDHIVEERRRRDADREIRRLMRERESLCINSNHKAT